MKGLTAERPKCTFEEVQSFLFETWKMYDRSTKYIVKGIDKYVRRARRRRGGAIAEGARGLTAPRPRPPRHRNASLRKILKNDDGTYSVNPDAPKRGRPRIEREWVREREREREREEPAGMS